MSVSDIHRMLIDQMLMLLPTNVLLFRPNEVKLMAGRLQLIFNTARLRRFGRRRWG